MQGWVFLALAAVQLLVAALTGGAPLIVYIASAVEAAAGASWLLRARRNVG